MVGVGGGAHGSILEGGICSWRDMGWVYILVDDVCVAGLGEIGLEMGEEKTYRLDGKGVLRRLLLAIGSKAARCSAVGPGTCIEDDGSTSSESSAMPLKVDALRRRLRHWRLWKVFFLRGNKRNADGAG